MLIQTEFSTSSHNRALRSRILTYCESIPKPLDLVLPLRPTNQTLYSMFNRQKIHSYWNFINWSLQQECCLIILHLSKYLLFATVEMGSTSTSIETDEALPKSACQSKAQAGWAMEFLPPEACRGYWVLLKSHERMGLEEVWTLVFSLRLATNPLKVTIDWFSSMIHLLSTDKVLRNDALYSFIWSYGTLGDTDSSS